MTKVTETEKENESTAKKVRVVKKVPAHKSLAESIRPAVEQEERIGKLFYNERMKKNLDLSEIAETLRIRKVHLEAIEQGNYAELPPQPYSTGFVSSYARYLGLNEHRMTQLFKEEINAEPNNNKGLFMIEDLASEASVPSKRYILAGLIGLAVIAVVWGLVYGVEQYSSFSNTAIDIEAEDLALEEPEVKFYETAEPEKVAEVAEFQPSQVVITEESFVETETLEPEPKPTVVEVKVVKQDTWVEVRDRRKIYINRVMKPGETYQIPQGSGMILSVGKEDVEVLINGVVTPVITRNKKTNVSLDSFIEKANH